MRPYVAVAVGLIGSCTSTESSLSGGAPGTCAAGTKSCAGACVAFDDPAHGCGSASCDPCPAMTHAAAICVQGSCSMEAIRFGIRRLRPPAFQRLRNRPPERFVPLRRLWNALHVLTSHGLVRGRRMQDIRL